MPNSVADNELAFLREVLQVSDGGLTDLRASFYGKVVSGEIVLGGSPASTSEMVRVDYDLVLGWPNPLPVLGAGQKYEFHSEDAPAAPTPSAAVTKSYWYPNKLSPIYDTV